MNKAILASMAGIALSGLAAFGQGGAIYFDNYSSTVYNPVIYGGLYVSPGLAGKNVDDSGVELQLFYAYGTYTDLYGFMAAATPGVTTFINPGINPTGQYGTATSKGSPGGYYLGPDQVLPDWVPGETVTFMVEGWETAGLAGGPTFGSSLLRGFTDLWTETGAATANDNGIQPYDYPPANFNAGPPVLVLGAPEPATLALAGLGLLSLLALARWKKV